MRDRLTINGPQLMALMLVVAYIIFDKLIPIDSIYLSYISIITSMLFMFLCNRDLNYINGRSGFLSRYLCTVVVTYIIVLFLTTLFFREQSFSQTLWAAHQYSAVLLAFPLLSYLLYKNNSSSVMEFINIMTLIWNIIIVLQSFLYPRIIIPNYFKEIAGTESFALSYFRNGSIRISMQIFGNFMVIYNFYKIYSGKANLKKKFYYIVLFLVGCYCLIIIQQTRMYIVAVALSLLAMILMDKRKTNNIIIRRLLIVVFFLTYVFSSEYVSYLVSSIFQTTGQGSTSTTTRLYSLQYYFDYFFQHPLFGMGFANYKVYPSIVNGPLGIAYFEDVGIVGQLAKWGVFILPIFLPMVLHFINVLQKMKNHNMENSDYLLYVGLFAFFITSSFTLIILDKGRILFWPFLLAMFEFENIRIS